MNHPVGVQVCEKPTFSLRLSWRVRFHGCTIDLDDLTQVGHDRPFLLALLLLHQDEQIHGPRCTL